MSDVAVVGPGYVGLTTAACLAHLGHHVVCADVDETKVARLSKGEVGILEERLPELVSEGLRAGRLRFVVGAATAARTAEFVFLCVPTPLGDGVHDITATATATTTSSAPAPASAAATWLDLRADRFHRRPPVRLGQRAERRRIRVARRAVARRR